MVINFQGSYYGNNKVHILLMKKYMIEFINEYNLHNNYGDEIMRDHKSRSFFCEWLKKKNILNIESWILENNNRLIGGGIRIEEDELLTMFLLECE